MHNTYVNHQKLEAYFQRAQRKHHLQTSAIEHLNSNPNIPEIMAELYIAKQHENEQFLDIGSGLGLPSIIAANMGYTAIGAEIDKKLYNASTEFANSLPDEFKKPTFLNTDVFAPSNRHLFEETDMFYSFNLEEHLYQALDAIKHVGKPNSRVLIKNFPVDFFQKADQYDLDILHQNQTRGYVSSVLAQKRS